MSNKLKEGTIKIDQFDETTKTAICLQNPDCMTQPERMPKSSTSRRSLKLKVMLEELNYKEMNQITGGQNVSAKEYCATLSMLIENNWGRWNEDERKSVSSAYSKHC